MTPTTTTIALINDEQLSLIVHQLLNYYFPNNKIEKCESVEQIVSFQKSQAPGSLQIVVSDNPNITDDIRSAGLTIPAIALARGEANHRSSPFSFSQVVDVHDTSIMVETFKNAYRLAEQYIRLRDRTPRLATLADRERKIIALASEGVPNKTIASQLGISVKTVEKNRRNAYLKLSVTSTAEMASLVTFGRFFGYHLSGPKGMPMGNNAPNPNATPQIPGISMPTNTNFNVISDR